MVVYFALGGWFDCGLWFTFRASWVLFCGFDCKLRVPGVGAARFWLGCWFTGVAVGFLAVCGLADFLGLGVLAVTYLRVSGMV